jgi:hypothetical protein
VKNTAGLNIDIPNVNLNIITASKKAIIFFGMKSNIFSSLYLALYELQNTKLKPPDIISDTNIPIQNPNMLAGNIVDSNKSSASL